MFRSTIRAAALASIFWASIAAAQVVGPGGNTIPPGASTQTQNLQEFYLGTYANNVPYCTGATIDTAVIQATINAAEAAGTGVVVLPTGCRVDTQLNITSGVIFIRGAGQSVTFLTQLSNTQNTFLFAGTAFDGGVSDLRIIGTGTATTGCAIGTTNGVGAVRFENLRIEHTAFGFCTNNTGFTGVAYLHNIDMAALTADAIIVNGTSQTFIDTVTCTTATGAGIHLIQAGGVYISNVTMGGTSVGFLVNPPTGSQVFHVFATNLELDTTFGPGVWIDTTGGGYAYLFYLDNIRSGFATGVGYLFDGPRTSGINMVNWTAERNILQGVRINNLQNSHLGYGQVINNAAGAPAPGIDVFAATAVTIDNSRASKSYPTFADSNQSYGAAIEASFTGSIAFNNDDFRGNTTGAIADASTGQTVVIKNVDGYNPVGPQFPALPSSGVAFTNGDTPSTVILNGGTCSAISVGGVALPGAACVYTTFPLAPHQAFIATYTVAPNFTNILQ